MLNGKANTKPLKNKESKETAKLLNYKHSLKKSWISYLQASLQTFTRTVKGTGV